MICFFGLNTNITIDCEYTSVPEGMLEIGWSNPNLTNVQIEDTTQIIITEATVDNIGNYSCSATNIIAGNVSYSRLTFDLRLEGI